MKNELIGVKFHAPLIKPKSFLDSFSKSGGQRNFKVLSMRTTNFSFSKFGIQMGNQKNDLPMDFSISRPINS